MKPVTAASLPRPDPFSTGELHGINAPAVIAAVRARAEALQRTGRIPDDGRKLGLVIEGGAMRSVYSAGGAVALAQMGFSEVFDEVYATSAGVMNASYFLSNQPMVGITVYYDSCTSAMFMNPLRVWKVLDIDYLFDQVITVDKPLDVEKVLASRTTFFVSAIDRKTGEGFLINTKQSKTRLLDILKAATAMPVLYNRSVPVDGRRCIDGGLAIPFPLPQALANGCTDVLVLLTRPPEYRSRRPSWINQRLFDWICARGNANLNEVYARHHEVGNASRDMAFGRTSPPQKEVNIATLCTERPETVNRTTSDASVLYEAAARYARKTLRVFGRASEAWSLPPPQSGQHAAGGG